VDAARRAARPIVESLDARAGPPALIPVSRPGDLQIPAGTVELVPTLAPAAGSRSRRSAGPWPTRGAVTSCAS
jgi:hypothetical protein